MKHENMITLILKSFLAGMMIGIGGLAYIVTGNPWVFPIGLLVVCAFDFSLFTGKICYLEYSPAAFLMMWFFNLIGAIIFGLLCRVAKPNLIERAAEISENKLLESVPQIAILAFFCNVMIFLAVEFWRKRKVYDYAMFSIGDTGGFMGLIFSTAVFVICGFEHCVANAFYFSFAGVNPITALCFLLVNTCFNAIGGILAREAYKRSRR